MLLAASAHYLPLVLARTAEALGERERERERLDNGETVRNGLSLCQSVSQSVNQSVCLSICPSVQIEYRSIKANKTKS